MPESATRSSADAEPSATAETAAAAAPKTQEQRKAESERRIIRAAMELFARQGYLRTTLIEVGKAAGYTGGLVSHRFGSKEGLLNAVVDNASRRFLEDQLQPAIGESGSSSAEDMLRNYIRTYIDEVFVREGHIRALYVIMGEALGSVAEIQPKIAQLNTGMRTHIASIIEYGIDSGEFNQSVNPEAAAVLVVGMLRGVTMQYLSDANVFPKDKLLPLLQSSILASIRQQPDTQEEK